MWYSSECGSSQIYLLKPTGTSLTLPEERLAESTPHVRFLRSLVFPSFSLTSFTFLALQHHAIKKPPQSVIWYLASNLLAPGPFHACLVVEGSAQALREELAELEDAGLQLVSADRGRRGRAAVDGLAEQLRPPPRTTSQQTEREVTSATNQLSPVQTSKQNQSHYNVNYQTMSDDDKRLTARW